jgi:hypothetical protein
MAEEKKNSFPVMPNAHWWGLRLGAMVKPCGA